MRATPRRPSTRTPTPRRRGLAARRWSRPRRAGSKASACTSSTGTTHAPAPTRTPPPSPSHALPSATRVRYAGGTRRSQRPPTACRRRSPDAGGGRDTPGGTSRRRGARGTARQRTDLGPAVDRCVGPRVLPARALKDADLGALFERQRRDAHAVLTDVDDVRPGRVFQQRLEVRDPFVELDGELIAVAVRGAVLRPNEEAVAGVPGELGQDPTCDAAVG